MGALEKNLSLGNLLQCLMIPMVKTFVLISSWVGIPIAFYDYSHFDEYPLSFVLLPSTAAKSLALSS